MKKIIKPFVCFLCILFVSSFQSADENKATSPKVSKSISAAEKFPFTIKCSEDPKGPDLKDSEIPTDLKNWIIMKKFNSGQNQVFIYMENGTADDPFNTGIYLAIYDKELNQIASQRLIDMNCDDPNTGGDGSDPKTSLQYVTFEAANSFKVFVEITSEAKGKDTSENSYKIDESGKIVSI